MTTALRRSAIGCGVVAALVGVAGCSHYLLTERAPWRHEAELACINSGVPEEAPGRVRISTIHGPGACGIDYPLKVSELGLGGPPGDDAVSMRPPSTLPTGSVAQQWATVQSEPLPPEPLPPEPLPPQPEQQYPQPQSGQSPYDAAPSYSRNAGSGAPQQYGWQPYGHPQYNPAPNGGAPMSLNPPGIAPPDDSDADDDNDAHPYYDAPAPAASNAGGVVLPPSLYSPRPMMAPRDPRQAAPATYAPPPPLGPAPTAMPAASSGPVTLQPAATLACPIVSVLDRWVSNAVQPAAWKWFHQPVVEIKQIGSYSCRAMVNGNPNAPISEHAFGNAIDIAEFDLADGHRITLQYGWHGTPQEQGFLHDVQQAACRDFNTVLAPGANVYHYNHMHVDLMRRTYRPHICEPAAIPGEIAAARARARYAAQHYYGASGTTGSIKSRNTGDAGDDDHLPLAVPGDD